MQVRASVYADDLVGGLVVAHEQIDSLAGRAFNIGGGPANTISLLELIDLLAEMRGRAPEIRFEEWRTGDQRYFVSDTNKFRAATGWTPRVCVREGINKLYHWLLEESGMNRHSSHSLNDARCSLP